MERLEALPAPRSEQTNSLLDALDFSMDVGRFGTIWDVFDMDIGVECCGFGPECMRNLFCILGASRKGLL